MSTYGLWMVSRMPRYCVPLPMSGNTSGNHKRCNTPFNLFQSRLLLLVKMKRGCIRQRFNMGLRLNLLAG